MTLTRFRVVTALGLVQILTWGSTFYLLAVLGAPIAQDTGWHGAWVMAGVSIALLTSAAMAPWIGKAIEARGGRDILTLGTTGLAIGLSALSASFHLPVYILSWVLIGCAMAATLYEAAFSTLGRHYGSTARSAITGVTLLGGFASTLCWPLSAFLLETFGWRVSCLIYAGLHLTVTLPLIRLGLPSQRANTDTAAAPITPVGWRDPRLLSLAVAGVCLAFVFSTISLHLIPILIANGYGLAAAVGLGALIGPAQVGARVLEMLGRGRHPPVLTLIVATGCVTAGLAGLAMGAWASAALIIYGCGTGLWSIARGTVPLASFGAGGYPAVMGKIAVPVLAASALAPIVGSWVVAGLGPNAALTMLVAVAVGAILAALIHWSLCRRASP